MTVPWWKKWGISDCKNYVMEYPGCEDGYIVFRYGYVYDEREYFKCADEAVYKRGVRM